MKLRHGCEVELRVAYAASPFVNISNCSHSLISYYTGFTFQVQTVYVVVKNKHKMCLRGFAPLRPRSFLHGRFQKGDLCRSLIA